MVEIPLRSAQISAQITILNEDLEGRESERSAGRRGWRARLEAKEKVTVKSINLSMSTGSKRALQRSSGDSKGRKSQP